MLFYFIIIIIFFFFWGGVPSHTGIGGNEKTDPAAKYAKVGFKHCISQHILSIWQGDWNGAVEIAMCRARIGHSHLTNSYILMRWVIGSILHGGPIELFVVPVSAPRLV